MSGGQSEGKMTGGAFNGTDGIGRAGPLHPVVSIDRSDGVGGAGRARPLQPVVSIDGSDGAGSATVPEGPDFPEVLA
jgi:hypothetical protein